MTQNQRAALYRARQRHGVIVVPLEVSPGVLKMLIRKGFLDQEDDDNRVEIAEAVRRALKSLCAGERP